MALLRAKDVAKMTDADKKTKLSELKMELIKANLAANKQNAKTKEIKRAISRLLTLSKHKNLPKTK
jgi:ribosomal protein L29